MIPTIGTAIIKNPQWVTRLYYSIDYPVENFIIINNNPTGELYQPLEDLKKINHSYVKNLHIVHLPGNIGVGGAWNLIIKSNLMSPYWIITNDDIAFSPGMLSTIVEKAKDDTIGMIHGNGGDFGIGGYDLFLIKDWVIKQVGIFDENLYPAYCEDADYIMRTYLEKIKVGILDVKYPHGTGFSDEYYLHGSQTGKTSKSIGDQLDAINLINFEYMTDKWGAGWRTVSPSLHPFNNPTLPVTHTTFDIEYARRKFLKI